MCSCRMSFVCECKLC
uniref:Uncharacterized protein n=1 Tax=Anguilla anguilla TaxID=7936 RepID=A0A0E9V1D6_ANGAN